MAGLRSIFRPLNRQVRQHVADVTTPRLDDLSGQIEDVRLATVEIRRLVTDDLDASNEVAAGGRDEGLISLPVEITAEDG